jgi:hypothetical protein
MLSFSPECPYCRAEMTSILKDSTNLKGIRFYFFTSWPFKEYKHFYDGNRMNRFPYVVTAQDYQNFFYSHFKGAGIPYTAIYDKNRNLKSAFIGRMTADQIKREAEN